MNTYTLVCINTYSSFYCWILPWDTTISMGLWKPCKHFSYFKSILSPPLLYMLSLSLLALGVHGAGYSKSLGTWLLHTAWEVFMEPTWMHPLIPGTPWLPQLGKDFPPCQGCITELPGASSVTCTAEVAIFPLISKKRKMQHKISAEDGFGLQEHLLPELHSKRLSQSNCFTFATQPPHRFV